MYMFEIYKKKITIHKKQCCVNVVHSNIKLFEDPRKLLIQVWCGLFLSCSCCSFLQSHSWVDMFLDTWHLASLSHVSMCQFASSRDVIKSQQLSPYHWTYICMPVCYSETFSLMHSSPLSSSYFRPQLPVFVVLSTMI